MAQELPLRVAQELATCSCVLGQDEAFSIESGEGGRREAPTYRNDGSIFVVPDAIR